MRLFEKNVLGKSSALVFLKRWHTHTQAAAAQLNAPRGRRVENHGLIKREQREEYEHGFDDDEETKSRRVARTRRKLEFLFQFPPKTRLGNARDVGVDVFRRTNRRRENA